MGLDERQRFRYLQHFQASQSSEGSVLDAADVVFIQLPAEHTGEREREERGFVTQEHYPSVSPRGSCNHRYSKQYTDGLWKIDTGLVISAHVTPRVARRDFSDCLSASMHLMNLVSVCERASNLVKM